jgi:WD40 repeat protein
LEFARADQAGDPYAFRFAPQDYLLRGEGGGFENSSFPWDAALLADLQALQQPQRDPALAARIGERLRRFLTPMGWAEQESRILAAVAANQPFLLTIRSAAAELYALPWELLTIKATGQHIAELPGVMIRFEWPDTRSAADGWPHAEGGRILFAWSAALGAVPAAEHQRALERACQAGYYRFAPETDVLAHASCGQLSEVLAAAGRSGPPIRVLHLLCHGAASGSSFGLGLCSDGPGAAPGAEPVVVDAGRLRQLLAPYAPMLRLVVLCACDSGNTGALGSQLGSVAQTLHRAGIGAVVASRLPLSVAGSVRLAEALYGELLGGPASLESALARARRQLAEDARQLDWASVQLYARSGDGDDTRPLAIRPYRGLLSFQPEHRRFFFGREHEIADIVARLRELRVGNKPRLLAVDGGSGSGKSSVVLAGATAELLRLHGEGAVLIVRRPGSAPLDVLADLPQAQAASPAPTLLVIDQFEELFTHTPDTPAGRQLRTDFARRLWALATAAADTSVVLTLRSDFVSRCGELWLDDSQRLDSVLYQPAHRVSIAQLGRAQLRAVIERPADRVGLVLEAGLCERLLADVEAEPGALPLLADTLDALWLSRRGRVLTQEAYDALGGVAGTLTGRADRIVAALDADELRIARRLLVRLVSLGEDGSQRTRLQVPLSDLQPADPAGPDAARLSAVVERLVDARLLVRGHGAAGAGEVLEVAHEALLRRWQRLGEWLEEDRQWLRQQQRLAGWTREFGEHRTLLRGHQLATALEWTTGHTQELAAATRELLAESCAAQAREEEAARLARDSRRVLAAQQLDFDPTRAVLLLREVESKDPVRVPGWLSHVHRILHREVLTCGELTGHQDSIQRVCFSPDGTRIATAAADGTLRVWESTGAVKTVPLPREPVLDLAFSAADGKLLVALSAAGPTVQICTLAAADAQLVPGPKLKSRARVSSAVFVPGGSGLAFGNEAGELWLVAGGNPGDLTPLGAAGKGNSAAPHQGAVTALCYAADGTALASAGRDGQVRLWSLKRHAPLRTLLQLQPDEATDDDDTSEPVALALHPAGTHIAIGQAEGSVQVLRTDGSGAPLYLDGHEYRVTSLAFSPDGRLLCSTSTDGSGALWGFAAPGHRATLSGHRGDVNHAAFVRDGDVLATAGGDGVVRIWDLQRRALDTPTRLAPGETLPASFLRCLWREDQKDAAELRGPARVVEHPATRRVARADAAGTVVVTSQGKPLGTLPSEGGPVTALAFRPDGGQLAVARQDRRIRLWSLSGGGVTVLSGHPLECHSLAYSPDGRLLAAASLDFNARLWQTDRGGTPFRLLAHDGAVTIVVFSPDGRYLATASESDGLWLWDRDGTQLPLIEPAREEYCVAVRSNLGACITRDRNLDTESADDAERFVWPIDLDPASLIERLWRAAPICLSVEERCQLLGESIELAQANVQRSLARVRSATSAAAPRERVAPPAFSWDGPPDEESADESEGESEDEET